MEVRSCFTPSEHCAPAIEIELGNAKKEILVAMYAFTSRELALALKGATDRGVVVRVLLDWEADQKNTLSQGNFLRRSGIEVRNVTGQLREKGETRGIMHHKFAVIDRKILITGSYNWSRAAETLNGENILIFQKAEPLAAEYRKEFEKLWKARRR
jgi:phosphatidylserine/phosphatidylglycerophosphate/cardiolipin synthase-like enzyme